MPNFDLLIQPAEGSYAWGLYPQGSNVARLQGQFQLDKVELKGKQVELARLDEAFTHFKTDVLRDFDEAAQLQLGQHLYRLLFATAPADLFPADEETLLRVVSDDAFIQRIPWNLLTRDQTFLVMENWHITVAAKTSGEPRTLHFADAPKVLLVCQAPRDQTANGAEEHANDLLQFLRGRYGYFLNPQALDVVSDWDGFVRKLAEQPWDVIYYYGHGTGDGYGASLLFADGAGKTMEVTMGKLASLLKACPPSLLYLNACRSGSNGIAGSIIQLGALLPALLVNRTDAFTDAAREQARIFLERLLLDHYPPHQAITHAYSSKGHGLASVRWMTPILYQHYTQWDFSGSNVQRFVGKDMHWYLKLDRTAQFSRVFYRTSDMLVSDSPSTLACFWYGTHDQGVDRFHERLPIELRKRSRDMDMVTFTFRWPPHFNDPHKACEHMVCEGFGVRFLDYLPGSLQNLATGGVSNPQVIHCRFATLRRGNPVRLGHLAYLLEWWGAEVHSRLRDYGIRALLAFAYELEQPDPHFGNICRGELAKAGLKSGMKLELLDELQTVNSEDILEFLDKFEVELPVTGDDRIHLIHSIVQRSNGNYEQILNELQTIVSQAYKLLADRMIPAAVTTDHGY
ncbi:CHAT domain-containing protein [Thiothrix lacustris]|uniref:CHAT domain-containing protein n=1 Tax=Thiothrix lacustris TaxID=525917 RepID=UPI0027E5281F|nr:CHAT domain-containing protein [Thiothrix lacustris]WMP17281.1 CHAT domain-containing protein [Thiothrix lacustris]